MKNIISTLTILFTLFFCMSLLSAQGNLEFSYTVNSSGNTTTVMVYATNTQAGASENMTSFTMNVYYDNTESTITNFDTSPTNALGWFSLPSSSIFNSNNNPDIPITHTGFGNINVLDFSGNGSSFGNTATHILTITLDNSIGSNPGGSVYLSSYTQRHAEQVYNDNVSPIPNAYPVVMNQSGSFPVEWLAFEAAPLKGQQTLLSWATGTELNNAGFEIERALGEGLTRDWVSIGFVEGQGSTENATEYEFVDPLPYSGENLYRLRQVDFNGDYSYSEVRNVWFEEQFAVSIYPNPTEGVANIRFIGIDQTSSDATYLLLDARGKQVQRGTLSPFNITQLNLTDLPEGAYLIRIVLDGKTLIKRIAKMY